MLPVIHTAQGHKVEPRSLQGRPQGLLPPQHQTKLSCAWPPNQQQPLVCCQCPRAAQLGAGRGWHNHSDSGLPFLRSSKISNNNHECRHCSFPVSAPLSRTEFLHLGSGGQLGQGAGQAPLQLPVGQAVCGYPSLLAPARPGYLGRMPEGIFHLPGFVVCSVLWVLGPGTRAPSGGWRAPGLPWAASHRNDQLLPSSVIASTSLFLLQRLAKAQVGTGW